jgi:hypothetical protein
VALSSSELAKRTLVAEPYKYEGPTPTPTEINYTSGPVNAKARAGAPPAGTFSSDPIINTEPAVGQAKTKQPPQNLAGVSTPTAAAPGVGLSGNTNADYGYNDTLNNLFRDRSQLDADANLAADRLKSGLGDSLAEAKRNYIKSLDNSTQFFGDSGTLRSGIFLKKQGDIGADYAKDSQSQISNAQKNLEDLARETASRKNALELQRQQAEKAQADAKSQADLQKALIEAQNKAYDDLKKGLLGVVNPTASPTVSPTGSSPTGGQTGTGTVTNPFTPTGTNVFQKDPETGGTLVDPVTGNPVTSAAQAQLLLAQRNAPQRSRQPGDGLIWSSVTGGYVEDPDWTP